MLHSSTCASILNEPSGSNGNIGAFMKCFLALTIFLLLPTSMQATMNVFAEAWDGQAWIRYECTAGEVVRAFALDISVDQGPEHRTLELDVQRNFVAWHPGFIP